MEKKAVIEENTTPPEEPRDGAKKAAETNLDDHVTKRLADAVKPCETDCNCDKGN